MNKGIKREKGVIYSDHTKTFYTFRFNIWIINFKKYLWDKRLLNKIILKFIKYLGGMNYEKGI